ncbi:hypothetical protein NIES267_53710 [Calothrix parasitica NIES-267]|uniref:Uncharacterized protein n=1 Tax=Calothrix parasitica NIES-267 TaxID=1973488 RepID=A0A1Z4LX84_9CYAN|nr:hypothetical protein NIES267_53710 [Calothrix parasitica NIES-267]
MTNFCNLSDYSHMIDIFLVVNMIKKNEYLVHIVQKINAR